MAYPYEPSIAPHLPVTPTTGAGHHARVGDTYACSCGHTTAISAVQPRRRNLSSVSAGPVVAVLLGGVVLTALLTAIAVSAVSVAVAAVALRSLLGSPRRQR